jgi:hypothetical protein
MNLWDGGDTDSTDSWSLNLCRVKFETVQILWLNAQAYLMFCWPCIVIYPYNKNQEDALFTINLFQ